jgi:hypothetical protein
VCARERAESNNADNFCTSRLAQSQKFQPLRNDERSMSRKNKKEGAAIGGDHSNASALGTFTRPGSRTHPRNTRDVGHCFSRARRDRKSAGPIRSVANLLPLVAAGLLVFPMLLLSLAPFSRAFHCQDCCSLVVSWLKVISKCRVDLQLKRD